VPALSRFSLTTDSYASRFIVLFLRTSGQCSGYLHSRFLLGIVSTSLRSPSPLRGFFPRAQIPCIMRREGRIAWLARARARIPELRGNLRHFAPCKVNPSISASQSKPPGRQSPKKREKTARLRRTGRPPISIAARLESNAIRNRTIANDITGRSSR
jgi:hypothetical protein